MENKPIHLNDLFWTFQGEGFWTGRRALFVRLPWCNYDCPWCDTEYNSYKEWSEENFLHFCQQESSRFAVITGGEPLAHKHLKKILQILKEEGFYIACETNGSLPAPEEIDFVTCSPKSYTKGKLTPWFIHPDLKARVSEYKYVVDDQFDFTTLARHSNESDNIRLSLSPEFNELQENLEKIMSWIQKNPRWQLSLQTHKWINIP